MVFLEAGFPLANPHGPSWVSVVGMDSYLQGWLALSVTPLLGGTSVFIQRNRTGVQAAHGDLTPWPSDTWS